MAYVTEEQARNAREQAALYGSALHDVVTRVSRTLGLTQARIASVLGLSAPMLSQLVQAHRVKIGNPAALQRLELLVELAAEVESGAAVDVDGRLADIQTAGSSLSVTGGAPVADALRRAGIDDAELAAAAKLLAARHPRIAALLSPSAAD